MAAPGGPGGARPGAGRPRKAEKWARPIAAAERQIVDKLPLLVGRMLELADGVTVSESAADGAVRVYTRAPDRQACEYLVNRIMGKPIERQQHDIDSEISELLALLAAGREAETA